LATKTSPTLTDIEAARERIGDHARVTPVYSSDKLWRETGRQTLLKAENLQRTGSFKVRGAVSKLATLSPEERAAGVIAASAGNHGQAVAWAARELGIRATIFMPQDAPMAKVEPTLTYGGEVVLTGAGFDESLADALRRHEETGATFVHAFEDEWVIAGQGTIGLELADQVPDVDTVLIQV
jgi:threonine dehydratase